MHSPLAFLAFIAVLTLPPAIFIARRAHAPARVGLGPSIYLVGLAPLTLLLLTIDRPFTPLGVIVLALVPVLLAWFWFREFLALMAMSDDAFPGRNDKALWFVLMLILPPVGLVAFATFRRSYWAAEKPATAGVAGEWA